MNKKTKENKIRWKSVVRKNRTTENEESKTVTKCNQLKITAEDGKNYKLKR